MSHHIGFPMKIKGKTSPYTSTHSKFHREVVKIKKHILWYLINSREQIIDPWGVTVWKSLQLKKTKQVREWVRQAIEELKEEEQIRFLTHDEWFGQHHGCITLYQNPPMTPKAIEDAKLWLQCFLNDGPVESLKIYSEATKLGIADEVIFQARKQLKLIMINDGGVWKLKNPAAPLWRESSQSNKEGIMLELYKDGDALGIITDIETEETFTREFARLLDRLIMNKAYDGDWEFQLELWFKAAFDVIAKLRGYKANVEVHTLIKSGKFTPISDRVIEAINARDSALPQPKPQNLGEALEEMNNALANVHADEAREEMKA